MNNEIEITHRITNRISTLENYDSRLLQIEIALDELTIDFRNTDFTLKIEKRSNLLEMEKFVA